MPSNSRVYGRIAHTAICLCLAVSVAACATQTESRPEPMPLPAAPPAVLPPPPPPLVAVPEIRAKPSKTVTASYQGSDTAGQLTSSGEPYNFKDLTAASRSLPIGSRIKVTNVATGRSVRVRINDRGPFVHGRSLDLSKSAAEKIGITHRGLGRVRITRLSSHPVLTETESRSTTRTPASP